MIGLLSLAIIACHLVGDYVIQNDWMAGEKTKRWWPAVAHGLVYSVPYAVLIAVLADGLGVSVWPSVLAWAVIASTHMVIDRSRLAKHLIWAVNQLAPRENRYPWAEAKTNGGYSRDKPAWMSTWLMIIVDNTVHLLINTAAIYFLVMT